jgi:ribonuclease HI
MKDMKQVTIYADGACKNNPGPGGYGVVLHYGEHRKEISAGYRLTTNNRMEILAAIVGLESLKEPCEVRLVSDSQYLVNAIEKGWARRWRAGGWMRNNKGKAVNPDLWERLLAQCKKHKVRFEWVRGHAGHPENERCDELATSAAVRPNLSMDEVYEVDAPSTAEPGP